MFFGVFKNIIIILLMLSTFLNANNKVSIQLKWKHSFQFAGYYTAIEKGFYKDEGLEVSLKEIDFNKPYIHEVIKGNSQYGVSDTSIVVPKIQSKDVVLLAQIFQHSPLVLISKKNKNITTPYDLVGKDVMYALHNTGGVPFRALILKTIGSFDNIRIHNFTNYQDFIDDKVDVISAYSTDQPYWLKTKGIDVNIIDPKSYGIDFYGDCLFTTKKEIDSYPNRAKKIKRATIKGWRYALDHQDEIIDLIIKKYAPNKTKDQLKYEATGIYQMILPDFVDIGTIDKNRYNQVAKLYYQLGITNKKKLDDDFFYKDKKKLHFTQEEKKWLKDNPMVRIAVMRYWKYDKNGNNLHTDILKLINKYGNIGLKPIKFDRWADGFKAATLGETVHGIDNVSWSKERELNNFNYTKAYDFSPNYLIVKENSDIKSLDDLENKTIYLKKESIDHKIIEDTNKNIKVIDLNTDDEMYEKLANSNEAVAFMSYTVNKQKLRRYNLKIATTIYGKYSQTHIAISKKHPELQSIINKIYELIPREELVALQNKVYKYDKLQFSQKEQNWISKHKVIRFVANSSWEPFEIIQKDQKKYLGIASDYLKLVSKKTGIEFKLDSNITWEDYINYKNIKNIEFLPCVIKTHKNSEYFNFSTEYLEYPIVMVTKNDKGFLADLNDLSGKKVVIEKGFSLDEIIKQNHSDIELVYASSTKDALKMVSNNQVYAYVAMLPVASYDINKYSFFNLKIAGKTKYTQKLKMAMNNDFEQIGIDIINKALESISKEEKRNIYNKWISIKFENSIDYTMVWQLSGLFLFFIMGSLYWNRRLSKEIQKTKQREKELELANKKAKEATKSKSEFLANMSHEIRTPMNSIIGFSELLSKLIKDPIQKDYLDSIQMGGKALMAIINDILDLSKIEAGKFKIEKENINPKNIFNEMYSIFHAKINQKNLTFKIDIDENLPDAIIIDSVRVRQILLNLIGNAIKFTNNGTITLRVKSKFINDEKTKINLTIEVIDTGRGIAKEFQEKIFQAFEQTNADDAKVFAGTGLGLAICSKLVKLMNGTIKVKSEVQKGSRFIVDLYDIDVAEVSKEQDNEELDNIIFDSVNILVVDDVQDNRKLVTASLANENFTFIEATNGKEALDIVINSNSKIDLIFMDLRMPIMNGYEAADKIKEINKDIPIIAFTASVMQRDLAQIKDHGFDGYLRKPVLYNDLVKELMKHIRYTKEDEKKEYLTNIDINKELLLELPIIIQKLKDKYKPNLDKIKDKGDFSLIKDLIEEINSLSKEKKLEILRIYTQNILSAIDSFDIDKVSLLINEYDNMVKRLEKLYEENKDV